MSAPGVYWLNPNRREQEAAIRRINNKLHYEGPCMCDRCRSDNR
jgi:hypothetical protein